MPIEEIKMKSRPILFSGPMVQAILEGRKTQTRRIIKPQPFYEAFGRKFKTLSERQYITENGGGNWMWKDCCYGRAPGDKDRGLACPPIHGRCPHGQPGDRLWVRETFGTIETLREDKKIVYRADGWKDDSGHFKWKPSIFMPRWASRILLEVTDIRVERLQDISEGDAKAEGVSFGNITDQATGEIDRDAVEAYEELWESINGAESWDVNPWVWVIEFRRIEK